MKRACDKNVMDITITPSALKFMRRMVHFGGGSQHGFRLMVTAGGCSGLGSDFSIEAAPWAGDSVLEADGLRIFLTADTRRLLEGATIDFSDTPASSGLTFVSTKAAPCACSGAGTPAGLTTIDPAGVRRRC